MAKRKPEETVLLAASIQDNPLPVPAEEPALFPTSITKQEPIVVENEFPLKPGHYLIMQVIDGEEVPGSAFQVTPDMFRRFYTDETKFVVKKKA